MKPIGWETEEARGIKVAINSIVRGIKDSWRLSEKHMLEIWNLDPT